MVVSPVATIEERIASATVRWTAAIGCQMRSHACLSPAPRMQPGPAVEQDNNDAVQQSRWLVKSSKELINQSVAHLETARHVLGDARLRIHEARNVLQVAI